MVNVNVKMETLISLSWDFTGWKESWPNLDAYSVQYDWNSTLLTMINKLRLELTTKNENSGLEYNTIRINSNLHNNVIQDMLFYRIKGHKRYIGQYRIVIDETLQNNEIFLYDKNKPEELNGLITIENLN